MASKKVYFFVGCGILLLAFVVVTTAVVGFVVYASKDVEGVSIAVEGPDEVTEGETFDLVVAVTNDRPKKVLALSDIDIGEDYLEGFTVSKIEPKPKSNMHVPVANSRSYTFDAKIPPKEAKVFTFTLRAEKTGLWKGDVDVCEGTRVITDQAQTTVKEKK